MKLHPRIRKTIKWGGAVVTVLLAVVWIGSGWITVRWSGGSYALEHGRIVHSMGGHCPGVTPAPPRAFETHAFVWPEWDSSGLHWSGRFADGSPTGGYINYTPLWPVIALVLAVPAGTWTAEALARRRLARLARLSLCPKCNYDRSGLATGAKCPECGASPRPIHP